MPAGDFNGLQIRDLDWIGSAGSITGLNITTNLVNWSDSFASFTADSVAINFAEYSNIGTGHLTPFEMTIVLNTTHAVPEPSPFALLGLGLIALGVVRKRG